LAIGSPVGIAGAPVEAKLDSDSRDSGSTGGTSTNPSSSAASKPEAAFRRKDRDGAPRLFPPAAGRTSVRINGASTG
jgi:hypothetical protein